MEEITKNNEERQNDFCFSKTIKAGKRIYYVDVKKSRNDDMYISLTESKKVVSQDEQVNFEKHKIFLYREDLEEFGAAFNDALAYIRKEQGLIAPRASRLDEDEDKFKLDIDF